MESRNGNYRKENKRLIRQTQCHAKKVKLHDAHIDWITAVYNFVHENQAARECINPEAKRFEVKYQKQSAAMIEGLIDHRLALEELLMMKFPSPYFFRTVPKAEHNDYVVVCNEEWEATFKQLKKYGKTRVLHPLNAKYEDIELSKNTQYRIIGVVVEKKKKYR